MHCQEVKQTMPKYKRMARQYILEGGRAKAAQVYPNKLCKAICEGLIEQMEADRKGQFLVADYNIEDVHSSKEVMNLSREFRKQYKTVEEDCEEEVELAWDDVFGAELNPKAIRQARKEEIDYVRKMKLYSKVPIRERYRVIGKAPISVRWIDINKGDVEAPNYRSRFVAREINIHKREDLFAATPLSRHWR